MADKKNKQQDAPLFQGLDLDKIHPVETVTEEQAEKYVFDTVDFSDPNRPKTCLEVDFPILKVNQVASLEVDPACRKPIYKMSKWWARRSSAVFRSLCIAAATKAPIDESKNSQLTWSQFYRKNHQGHKKFSSIKVLDIFMGGGTTVVEASRLGFDVTGIDLSPLAWWVVYNETHSVKVEQADKLYQEIVENLKSEVMPFFISKSPRGFNGTWFEKTTNKKASVDMLKASPEIRRNYYWKGPEVIHTFWVKHIMCSDPSCTHLTPLMSSSVVALKTVKVKALENVVCPRCMDVFDLEFGDFRMAPSAHFVLSSNERSFSSVDPVSKKICCPFCNNTLGDEWINHQRQNKKTTSKEVTHTLVLDKSWLSGITARSKDYYGGYWGASKEQDERWFNDRIAKLKLIEIRGEIPVEYRHSNKSIKIKKGKKDEDVEDEASGSIVCGKCGRAQDPLSSIKITNRLANIFPYMIQGFDPDAKDNGFQYNGKFFDIPDMKQILDSFYEFKQRTDIAGYMPTEELFYGFQTHHLQGGVPNHGYTHWYKMFNPRQVYIHCLILNQIMSSNAELNVKSHLLGAFQNYLRQNCMFTIWSMYGDQLKGHFSNNNYHPKSTTVENSVFSDYGSGNFSSCYGMVREGLNYMREPYDRRISSNGEKGKSQKVFSSDWVQEDKIRLFCQSSTDLKNKIQNETIDLVITDPPFGDNINYSELADFFMVWLHKPLSKIFPQVFTSPESPKALEAVSNKARNPGEADDGKSRADMTYDRLLTLCWKEAYRVLKYSGIMAFTFHHDKDIAWINVLESLFKAGFIVESAFPIRSDSTKGDGDFGSKKIEYDIVHVCKKRHQEPSEIYWATLRKKILESVKSRSVLLAQHKESGLHLADLEVIIRGEVLEQYSYHYGKVKKNLAGDLMSVREILIEANNIAQSMLQIAEKEKVPDSVDPETKILFSLFRDGVEIEFNAARKRLKGSGTSLEEIESLGWVQVSKKGKEKFAALINIGERWNSLSRKRTLTSDLDQAHFAINCCVGNRQLDGKPAVLEDWIEQNYKSLLPSLIPLLKYMETNHFGAEYKQFIGMAYRTLERTLNKIKETDGEFKKASAQMTLFDFS